MCRKWAAWFLIMMASSMLIAAVSLDPKRVGRFISTTYHELGQKGALPVVIYTCGNFNTVDFRERLARVLTEELGE